MHIDEIKKRKRELAIKLMNEVVIFQQETGLKVKDVGCRTMDSVVLEEIRVVGFDITIDI